MISMRRRLVLSIGLSSFCLSSIACVVVWFFSQQQLHQRLDAELEGNANHTARRSVYEYYMVLRWKRDNPNEEVPQRSNVHLSYCLFDPIKKSVLHHTGDLNDGEAAALIQDAQKSALHTCTINQNRNMRAYTHYFDMSRLPRSRRGPKIEWPDQLAIVIARSLKDIHENERDLAIALLIVTLMSSALSAIAAAIIGSQTVKPIHKLSAAIADIHAHALDQPIDLDQSPVELNPIIKGLNQALERLADAFQREKQLTADLAHELRTPLAVIRSELDQLKSLTEGEPRQLARNARCAAGQMQKLAERILLLSRLESGHQQIEASSIDLADEIEQRWSILKTHTLQLKHSVPLTASIKTDKTLLRMVLDNLFGNAVSYAPADTTVSVAYDQEQAQLTISNSCGNIEPIDCEAAFTLYWRGDTARSNSESHAGLGLPLVKRMMHSMGGDAYAEHDLKQQRFCVVLQWPKQTDS